jgi:hypothetical protein
VTTDPSLVSDDQSGWAGDGAREVHARLAAARLRRVHAEGASADGLIAALEDAPAHELAWALGAEGEEVVAGILDAAAELRGFGVLHDLSIPGSRANIDHVVVGAAGVTVIDTKAWSGAVRVSDRGVRIGGWNKRADLEAIVGQVELVADTLRESGFDVPVRGVLCLANRNAGAPLVGREASGVTIGTPEAVVASVSCAGPTTRADALTIMGVLERRFRPRAVVPVGTVLLVHPETPAPPAPSATRARRGRSRKHLTVAPPRRRARSAGRRRPVKGESLGALLARLALVGVLFWGALTALDHAGEHARLTPTQVLAMRPGLRARAVAAAGGQVHGPSIAWTPARARLRYRRGRCHIRIDVDRETARSAADGVLTIWSRCRTS